MILIPIDIKTLFILILITFLLELLRIVIGVFFTNTRQLNNLNKQKLDSKFELSKIKSVQLELVKHSKITRKINQITKDIEKVQENRDEKIKKLKSNFQIVRVITFIILGVYFFNTELLRISPNVLWPYSIFTSLELVSLPAWLIVLISSAGNRFLLRSMLPIILYSTEFP